MSHRLRATLSRPKLTAPWLVGFAAACLCIVLGVEMIFDRLQDRLRAQLANEAARLFVGEEIVRGIQGLEKDIYSMSAATSPVSHRRVLGQIDAKLAKLRHDLGVLEQGGTVTRTVSLNLSGLDEMVREATYVPTPEARAFVMETIEITPLLDQVRDKALRLDALIDRRQDCMDRQDPGCLYRLLPEITLFMKQLPPYFERLNENANRLFADGSGQLRELEQAMNSQGSRLKAIEMTLLSLIIVLAGTILVVFMRRLEQTNAQLNQAITEITEARNQAERASRAKSEFVSRMSHELRTPLNAIIGFADILEDEPLSPSHRGYVGLIQGAGRHLMELINAVLDHAKIEAGGLQLEQIAFDLPDTIEAVRTMIAERADARGLEFTVSLDPALPRYLVGDPTRLRQVLLNLLNNAVKFTEHGSVALRIGVDQARLIFSIRDTGIGMDEAAQARLFQPFSQADGSITRKYGGTGLGLMITKELIEAMDGGIEVESAPGVGTCFWFSLPLRVAEAPDAAGPAGTPTLPAGFQLPGPVLLVDDNRVNQRLAGAMLDRLGLVHVCADHGAEALERIAGTDFALILMDMEMPVMDGISATRELRRREAAEGRPPRPVVAMTANALSEDRERCFQAGMNGYIAKPVSLGALRAELARLFPDSGVQNQVEASAEPGPPSAAEAPIHDRAAALEAMAGDEDIYREVLAVFVGDAPVQVAACETALAAGDLAGLARAAHTLKGLFATFAAAPAEQVARQLELAARGNDPEACAIHLARLRAEAERLLHALAEP